jgi:hypothetical protein
MPRRGCSCGVELARPSRGVVAIDAPLGDATLAGLRVCVGTRRRGRGRAALCLKITVGLVGLLCGDRESKRCGRNDACEDPEEGETSHA